jgi:hypothetical protein
MLTALALALVLGQPSQPCATCGGNSYGWGAEEGATGWFPFCSPKGWNRIMNMCNGPIIGLGAAKCPCALGAPVPYGDQWAMQMHANYSAAPATSAPTPPPAPTPAAIPPAPATEAPQPPAGAPAPAAPASTTPPPLPPATSPSPLTPLP